VARALGSALAALITTSTLATTPALAADGAALFGQICALCHLEGGVGSPGLAPPLADKELWDRLGSQAPGYIAGVMLAGFSGTIEVAGTVFSGLAMPPQDRMSDEELAAIGNYVLSTLNGSREKLLPSDVAKLRAAPPTHAELRATRRTGH
jgi:mono/diheme cytochrome c family protein